MECKASGVVNDLAGLEVLIETLWNVKILRSAFSTYCDSVLIETLWNVKTFLRLCDFAVSGINRNIVECKVDSKPEQISKDSVLIETLWNVKLSTTKTSGRFSPY